jgi:hypothetical protein
MVTRLIRQAGYIYTVRMAKHPAIMQRCIALEPLHGINGSITADET